MEQYYVGLDIGKKWTYATMIDEEKNVIREGKLPCNEEAVERFLLGKPKESLNVAMEACGIWNDLHNYLLERCKVVKVVNPLQTKMNIGGKKTDKLDSKRLAVLLKGDVIEEAYIPNKDARNYRDKVRHRQSMVNISTGIKNAVHGILRRENIKYPEEFDDLFSKRGIVWLRSLKHKEINSYLKLLPSVEMQIVEAKKAIPINMYKKEIKLIKTMPGIGDITAPVIMSEIVDIKRFPTPRMFCKHAGLVPKVIQSGDSDRRGGLVKQCSKRLKTALIQSAQAAVKTKRNHKLKMFFLKLMKRKTYNTAKAAVAHKMAYILWFMLNNNEEFHENRI